MSKAFLPNIIVLNTSDVMQRAVCWAALCYKELLPWILCRLGCCSGMYTHCPEAMHYGAWCVCCYAAELIEHDVNQESFKSAAAASDFTLCNSGDLQHLN